MRIDIATAQELISNYKQNHWTIINGCCPSLRQNPAYPNVEDSRSVWFSLDDLQNFINDINAANGNGIRFYFGEYSADIINAYIMQMQQNPPQNANGNAQAAIANISQCVGLQTIVMIPTALNASTNLNCDFNIVTQDTTFDNPGDLAAENHGSMIPPPWPRTGGQSIDYTDSCGAYFMDL